MAVTSVDNAASAARTFKPEEEKTTTQQGGTGPAVAEQPDEPSTSGSATAFAERSGISADHVRSFILRPQEQVVEVGGGGGGDGAIPADALDTTTPLTFGGPGEEVEDYGLAEQATTGAEAARRLQDEDTYDGIGGQDAAADDYAATIERHKNDPQFLEEFFEALGPEKTAEMTARAAERGTVYSIVDGREIDAKSAVAEGLGKAGGLLSGEFDQRFAAAAAADAGTALAVSDVLDQGGSGTRWLQGAFLRETLTAGRALNTNGDDQYNAYLYARAASGVMAASPQLAHDFLGVGGSLTDAERGAFIKNNVAFGPLRNGAEVNDGFERVINGLSNEDFQNLLERNPNEVRTMVDQFSNKRFYGGQPALANLINKAANLTGSDGAPTAEALGLFDYAMDRVGVNDEAKSAAQSFFNRHSTAVMDHMRQLPGGADGKFLSGGQIERLQDLGVMPRVDGSSADYGPRIADWLGGQSSDVQAEFMHHMMGNENGQVILKTSTTGLSDAQRQNFSDGIEAAYARDPATTLNQINGVGDRHFGAWDPPGGGFSQIIKQTGDANIIGSYAAHKMKAVGELPPGAPAATWASRDVATALEGMTPAQLQEFVAAHANDGVAETLLKGLSHSEEQGGPNYDQLSRTIGDHLVDTLTAGGLTEDELERVRSTYAEAPRAVTADAVAKLADAARLSGDFFSAEEMRDLGDITSYYFQARNITNPEEATRALTDLVSAVGRNLPPDMPSTHTGYITGTLAAGLAKHLNNIADDEAQRNAWLSALTGSAGDGLSAGIGLIPHPAARAIGVGLAAFTSIAEEMVASNAEAPGQKIITQWLGGVRTNWQQKFGEYGWTQEEGFRASETARTAMENNGFSY